MQKMLEKVLLVMFVILTLPVFANGTTYWQITATTSPVTLKKNLTAARPANFGNYTTPGGATYTLTNVIRTPYASVDFDVAAVSGYIVKVKVDGIQVGTVPGTYTVDQGTLSSHTIVATYTVAPKYIISTTTAAGGHITPSLTATAGTSPGITITPFSGYLLTGVKIDGITYAIDAALPAFVTKTGDSTGAVYTFPAVSAAHSMQGVFTFATTASTVISTGNQTLEFGASVLVDGSASSSSVVPTTYTWTNSCGTLTANADPKKVTFTAPATVGPCTVTLTMTGAGISPTPATVTFTTINPALAAAQICLNCHNGTTALAAPGFTTSPHYGVISCADCHNPGIAWSHPFAPLATIYQTCGTCHFDTSGNVPLHPAEIGTNTCVTCHSPHSTAASWLSVAQSAHYNNITSGNYPASYVSSRAVCADCHFETIANGINRHEWAISKHGAVTAPAWTSYDFKTMTGCVQCHTTTGFIAFSSGKVTAAWGDAADKTKEVLRCNGCHSDITNGTVRTVSPVRPYADDTYTNPDVGVSNVCMTCHSGTKNGRSITARLEANAAFDNMPFIDPHYMAAGGTMYGVAGYHFPGRTYTSDFSQNHQSINSVDSNNRVMGPCITCHKNEHFDHTFRPTWSSNPLCSSCHITALSDTRLSGAKSALANAMDVLRAQLAAKGFVYSSTYPYFNSTNWGLGVDGANTMGAAFNYILVLRELGSFAHNSSYAKQLVIDSIDYLDNGVIDDSVAAIALPGLVASGAISQAVADSFSSYKAVNLCTTCHGGTSATSNPMSTNAHPAHLNSAYGPSAYLGTGQSACQTCHAYNSTQHMNRVVDVLNGAGSACANCHSGNVPAWGGTARLACTSCHSANPAVLPNGTAAPYKANFSSSGHGRFTTSNQCTICHDPDSPHISGSLGSFVRLRLSNTNAQCGSCHNGTNASAMSSHVLDMSANPSPSLCKECHDAHGTSNLHMIKTVINGRTIAFTNTSTGFVKMVAPFDGLCQACHTLTSHFRSGQTPDDHPDRNCLSCHSHTAAYAFKPAGTCDSCHGYPPVPAGFVGTQGNYTSARVEDYLGGTGAHTTEAHIKKTARPSEGWVNCTTCHGNGSLNPATHTMSMPVTPSKITIDVDDQYKFNASLPLGTGQYSGLLVDGGANATGTCSNVKCHFQATTKWSAVK